MYGDRAAAEVFQLSESVKEKLNKETQDILQQSLKDVEKLLATERVLLDRFVKNCLKKKSSITTR